MYDIARIEREMARQFLSREKLAKKAHVASSTVHRIFDTGTGSPEKIGALVEALGIDPDEVVVFKERIDLSAPHGSSEAKAEEIKESVA